MRWASVKAPRSCPNNSLSSNCSGMAPQLMGTNGPVRRAPAVWMAWATSSLPEPFSPVISTVASVPATRWTSANTRRIASDSPTSRW